MDQKKNRPNKKLPQLGSEMKPSEVAAHRELAHEDQDPIYPLDASLEEMKKGSENKKKK